MKPWDIVRGENGESGNALIELAIIAPMFILFVVGIIDLGRILMFHLGMTQLAYECVRIGERAPGIIFFTNCQCIYATDGSTEWIDETTCDDKDIDWEADPDYTDNAPPVQICTLLNKLYGPLRAAGDLPAALGTFNVQIDYPYPDSGNPHWKCVVKANFNGFFTNHIFGSVSVGASAVGPQIQD